MVHLACIYVSIHRIPFFCIAPEFGDLGLCSVPTNSFDIWSCKMPKRILLTFCTTGSHLQFVILLNLFQNFAFYCDLLFSFCILVFPPLDK